MLILARKVVEVPIFVLKGGPLGKGCLIPYYSSDKSSKRWLFLSISTTATGDLAYSFQSLYRSLEGLLRELQPDHCYQDYARIVEDSKGLWLVPVSSSDIFPLPVYIASDTLPVKVECYV